MATRAAANAAVRYLNPVTGTVFGSDQPAVTLGNLGNTTLKPERSKEFEIGVDEEKTVVLRAEG